MEKRIEFARLTLAARESVVLDHTEGAEVTVRKGCVWLTQHGDGRDIVLRTGQSFALSCASGTLVTGIGDAEVIVHKPVAAASPRRAGRGWLERIVELMHTHPANAVTVRRVA